MIVRITAEGTVRLVETDDLRRFSIAMPDTAAARAALASLARPDGRDHAWIAPDRVRALAGPTSPGWDERFAATIDHAAGKGWTDESGSLRAHIDDE